MNFFQGQTTETAKGPPGAPPLGPAFQERGSGGRRIAPGGGGWHKRRWEAKKIGGGEGPALAKRPFLLSKECTTKPRNPKKIFFFPFFFLGELCRHQNTKRARPRSKRGLRRLSGAFKGAQGPRTGRLFPKTPLQGGGNPEGPYFKGQATGWRGAGPRGADFFSPAYFPGSIVRGVSPG